MENYEHSSSKILVEIDGPVAIITINRPEVCNAIDNEAANVLARIFREFESDPDARVAVLTGAGGHFCAGADLKEIAAGEEYLPWAGDPNGPCHAILSKPIIAAITGYACAGGLGMALRCDLRIVEEDATFAVLSRRWGVPMSDGTTVRLPRLIGTGRALDMLLTGRKVDAAEAVAIGLADRLVSSGQARAAAIAMAHEISAFPQIAMRSDRLSAIRQWDLAEAEAIEQEMLLSAEARSAEAMPGAARFAAGAGRHGSSVNSEAD